MVNCNFGSASFDENCKSLDSNSEPPKANNINGTDPKDPFSKTQEIEDTNEHLDYDAEDGECNDSENKKSESDDKKVEVSEELEEGEILDNDTFTPETFVTRIVCKYFLRGRCSRGLDCYFLHCVHSGDQVSNPWEHSLIMARKALHDTEKNKKKLQEEFDYESRRISSPEIIFTRYPRRRHYYTPVQYSRRQENTYAPEYSRIRPREIRRSKHENEDLYKSKKSKRREVSILREKKAWKRSNSTKRRRNYSSSNSSTSDSSSSSSSTSRSSSELHKKQRNRRSLNHKENKEQNSDKYRRSRKQIVISHEKSRRTKRLIESSSSSGTSDSSSSTSDSDSSASKTRSRNNRKRSDASLKKNRQRSSSPLAAPRSAHSTKKQSEKAVLIEKLKNIEKALEKYKKH